MLYAEILFFTAILKLCHGAEWVLNGCRGLKDVSPEGADVVLRSRSDGVVGD